MSAKSKQSIPHQTLQIRPSTIFRHSFGPWPDGTRRNLASFSWGMKKSEKTPNISEQAVKLPTRKPHSKDSKWLSQNPKIHQA